MVWLCFFLHYALSLAAQCIVIGPVCGFVCLCVCLWVFYHDNSKLRASIFNKLGLSVKVVTISNWLNFGRPAPPGRGSAAGRKFLAILTTASAQCLRLSERFFIFFSEARAEIRPFDRFWRTMAQNARNHARMCLLGVRIFNFNTDPYLPPKRQILAPKIAISSQNAEN